MALSPLSPLSPSARQRTATLSVVGASPTRLAPTLATPSNSGLVARLAHRLAAVVPAGLLALAGCESSGVASPSARSAQLTGDLGEAPLDATTDSDEFADAAALGAWGLRSPLPGGVEAAYVLADVSGVVPGALTLRPRPGAWYGDAVAAHLYRSVTGDFVATTHVIAGRPGAPNEVPTSLYNDAGLLARDPLSITGQSWLAALVGQTDGTPGTLSKSTRFSTTAVSYLAGGHAGELRICRVGSTFRTLRRLDGESEWSVLGETVRADLPAALDVGPVANAWQAPVDLEARFDYVRFAVPASLDDCAREVAPLAAPEPGAEPVSPLVLDEDFEGDSLLGWAVREVVEGDTSHTDLIDVGGVTPGRLTLDAASYNDPTQLDGGAGPAWFQDRNGVFVYRELSGDFAVLTDLRVGTRDNINQAPDGVFNSAGILVRDPSSFDAAAPSATGQERWVVYNLGSQQGFLGTEVKTTFPGGGGSRSSLFLTPTSGVQGRMVVCRVGGVFRFFRNLVGEAGWTEDVPSASNLVFDGAGVGAAPQQLGFVRPDMANTLQVGLMVNRWADGSTAPVRADFERFQVASPATPDDCLTAFGAP